jgi:hypothetical protein
MINEKHHNLHSSPGIIRMVKSRRMRWAGHVPRVGKKRNAYGILVGESEGIISLEDQNIGGLIILKWMLERQDEVVWAGLIWLTPGTSGGFF